MTSALRTLMTLAAVVGVALLTMSDGQAAVFIPMVCAVGLSWAFVRELWRRDEVLPLDEVGLWFAAAVTVYAVWPLLVFQVIGLQYTLFNDNRLFRIQPSPGDVARIGWWHVGFLGSFAAAYLLVRGNVPPAHRESPRVSRSRLIMTIAVWMGANVVMSLVSLQFGGGDSASTHEGGYAVVASLPLAVRQIMRLASSVGFVVDLVLLVWLFSDYQKRRWIIWIWLGNQVVSIALNPGARTGVMLSLLACFILYHLRVRHVRPMYAALFGFVGLVGFLILGVLRALGGPLGGGAILMLPLGGEFESLFANAVDLYSRHVTGGIPPIPLGVHLADIIAPIPSQLLPFQKFDPANWYMATFYPEALEMGHGLAFGSLAQAAIGMGLVEVLIRGALLGVIFAGAFRFYRRRQRRLWTVVGYLWITLWSYQSYRASTLALFSPFIQQFLFTVILFEVGSALLEGASRFYSQESALAPVEDGTS